MRSALAGRHFATAKFGATPQLQDGKSPRKGCTSLANAALVGVYPRSSAIAEAIASMVCCTSSSVCATET